MMNADESSYTPTGSNLHHRWTRIESKLRRAKARLVTAGSIHRHRVSDSHDGWVVRYRERIHGKMVQRTIYLGPEPLAMKARALIQRWRAEAITPEMRRKRDLLQLYDLTGMAKGYSRRARQRLRNAAVKSFDDPIAGLKFTVGLKNDDGEIRNGSPPSRPAKSGLW